MKNVYTKKNIKSKWFLMNGSILKNVATQFALDQEELIELGIKAFLQDQLHRFEIERRTLFSKHNVNALDEFDQLLINYPDDESNLLEEFQRADYLSHQIEKTSRLIKELNNKII